MIEVVFKKNGPYLVTKIYPHGAIDIPNELLGNTIKVNSQSKQADTGS